jgi:hypothetical protein
MPESTLADSIAAADRRTESMSLLCEMLCGQVKHQRQELQEIKSAIACAGKQDAQRHAIQGVIGPEMLV